MTALPTYLDPNKNLMLMQNNWKSKLDPVLSTTIVNGRQLSNIILTIGPNVINTKLGRKYQGYFITGMRNAFAQIIEVPTGDLSLTLTLSSNAVSTIDVWVY